MPNKVSHCGPNPNDKISLYCIIVEGKVDCHKHEPLALKLSIRFKTKNVPTVQGKMENHGKKLKWYRFLSRTVIDVDFYGVLETVDLCRCL